MGSILVKVHQMDSIPNIRTFKGKWNEQHTWKKYIGCAATCKHNELSSKPLENRKPLLCINTCRSLFSGADNTNKYIDLLYVTIRYMWYMYIREDEMEYSLICCFVNLIKHTVSFLIVIHFVCNYNFFYIFIKNKS